MKSKHFKIWISACFAKYMISNNRASPHYIRPFFSLVHLYNIIKCLVNTNDVFICKFFKYTKLFSWAFQSMSHGGGEPVMSNSFVTNIFACYITKLVVIAMCVVNKHWEYSSSSIAVAFLTTSFFSRECKSKLNKDNFAKNCWKKIDFASHKQQFI